MSRDRPDPSDMSVRKAVERYLRRRRSDATDASVKSWKYRLKLFTEWCEGVGVDAVGGLRPYDVDEYFDLRSGRVAPSTLESEMWTLKSFLRYLEEQLGAVQDDLSESVRIPDLDPEDRSDDTSLRPEDAFTLLDHYRDDETVRATRAHAFLELAWYTGARQGGLRSLDVRDLHVDEEYIEFRHRPDTGTPLKNKIRGERPVGLPSTVIDVLAEYIRKNRHDVSDEYGRQPLLPSSKGRPTNNTVRNWSYRATQPCIHSDCPHGKSRGTCEWREYVVASKCPSSRSPHKIRTGSITWQLNLGLPPEVVAERVNASVSVIEEHYDWATEEERWRRRRDRMESRREYVEQLDLGEIDE